MKATKATTKLAIEAIERNNLQLKSRTGLTHNFSTYELGAHNVRLIKQLEKLNEK